MSIAAKTRSFRPQPSHDNHQRSAIANALRTLADVPSSFFVNAVCRRMIRGERRWAIDMERPHAELFPHLDKRVRRLTSANNQKEAEAVARHVFFECIRDAEAALAPKAPTFAEFVVNEWWPRYPLKGRKGRRLAGATAVGYLRYLRLHLLPALGSRRFDELSVVVLDDFLNSLLEEYTPKFASNVRGLLTLVLNSAHSWQVIPNRIAVPLLAIPPSAFDFLTFDEKALVLAAAANATERTMFRFAMETGVRSGELIGLAPSDISWERRRLTVARSFAPHATFDLPSLGDDGSRIEQKPGMKVPKDGEARHVPLRDELLGDLLALDRTGPRLFPEADPYTLSSRLNAAMERAGLTQRADGSVRRLRFYDLRHTFASHLAIRGVPMQLVSRWMGHSSVVMTERYSHLAPSSDDAHFRGGFADERTVLESALGRGTRAADNEVATSELPPPDNNSDSHGE